jgi:hypothetical protein
VYEKAVRNDLYHIDQKDDADEKQCFPEWLLVFGTMQYITDAQHMLQEDDSLISETVIQEIDHISGAGLKAESP